MVVLGAPGGRADGQRLWVWMNKPPVIEHRVFIGVVDGAGADQLCDERGLPAEARSRDHDGPAAQSDHAGVVGLRGRAIMIPGPSFSGKSTLVAELVSAGAVYYSDEYAVLDDRGLVHPYPKPLSIRTTSWSAQDHHVSTLGGSVGTEPLPLGLVVLAQYRSGATWEPQPLSPGQALLALLANTVPAQERPEETMTALRSVIGRDGLVALEGERGEAAEMVQQLLESVPT